MGPNGYSRLLDFISWDMRMSHVYQPVMLRVLLENEGQASRSTSLRLNHGNQPSLGLAVALDVALGRGEM